MKMSPKVSRILYCVAGACFILVLIGRIGSNKFIQLYDIIEDIVLIGATICVFYMAFMLNKRK